MIELVTGSPGSFSVESSSGGVSVVESSSGSSGGSGTVRPIATGVIAGGSINETITHGLNTMFVSITVFETIWPHAKVEVGIKHASVNTLDLTFATAPASGQYSYVVFG